MCEKSIISRQTITALTRISIGRDRSSAGTQPELVRRPTYLRPHPKFKYLSFKSQLKRLTDWVMDSWIEKANWRCCEWPHEWWLCVEPQTPQSVVSHSSDLETAQWQLTDLPLIRRIVSTVSIDSTVKWQLYSQPPQLDPRLPGPHLCCDCSQLVRHLSQTMVRRSVYSNQVCSSLASEAHLIHHDVFVVLGPVEELAHST